MRVAIFTGSPRTNGNTATMAQFLANELTKLDVENSLFNLYEHNIEPCLDCRVCKADAMKCVQKDGMTLLYEKLEWADVIIFGTPIYWFGPSAQTKLMIDRFRPYFANKKLYGKKAALLLPAGSGIGDCEMTIEQFKRIFKALGMMFIDAIAVKAYDVDDVKNDPKVQGFIDDLVARITEFEI